jgi:hypothetical protein
MFRYALKKDGRLQLQIKSETLVFCIEKREKAERKRS